LPTEIELKLRVAPSSINTLLASDLLVSAPEIIEQKAIYFDTPQHVLFNAGFSLRVRKAGDVRTQTVKATSSATAGLFARSEWEQTVRDDNPIIDHSTPLLNQFGEKLAALTPVFEVAVQRQRWNLVEGGSEIEVALDRGVVLAADRQATICEIELELKSGSLAGLFELARKIDAVIPFHFEVLSKSERGYRLLDTAKTVFKAEPIELDRREEVTGVFQAVALACFRHFRLNENYLLDRRNPESLHQARVALRRLRSAFSTFDPVLQDTESECLKNEFRWLATVLGDARNVDVLLTEAKGEIRQHLFANRTQAYDAVIDALTSQRARSLMTDFNQWLVCGQWLTSPATAEARAMSAADLAAGALDRHRKKLKKHGESFFKTDDEHRHQVRKDAKKLRYAAEFFGPLFESKTARRRHRRFMELMESLQDVLGSLNDIATRSLVLKKLGMPTDAMPADAKSKGKLMSAAEDALSDLLEAKRFWR